MQPDSKSTTPKRPSTRAEAKRQTREALLDAAVASIIEVGYNGTSLREVASRAGLSHTGLLHHFPDKPSLLNAVLDDRLYGAANVFPLHSTDGATFIRALIDIAQRDAKNPSNVALLSILGAEATRPSHPAHNYFKQWHAEVRRRLTHAFEDLREQGRYHSTVAPEIAAIHVASMRDGLHVQWLMTPTEIDLVNTIRSQFGLYVTLES